MLRRKRIENQNTKEFDSFSLANENDRGMTTLYKYTKGLALQRAKSYLKDNIGTGTRG